MIKSKIIRDTALLTFMQLALDSAALLLNVFITRRMGASAIGIFSLMGSFLGLAGILSNGNAFLCTSRLVSEEIGRRGGSPVRVLFHGIKLCLLLSAGVSALTVLFAAPGVRLFAPRASPPEPARRARGALGASEKGVLRDVRQSQRAVP